MSDGTRYLLDTNAISERTKRSPNPSVVIFLASLPPENLFLSVLTLGELRKGAALKRKSDASLAKKYSAWIDELEMNYGDRILDVDRATGSLWGEWSASRRTRPVVDTLLAATALVHSLTLVTRNTKDIDDLPVRLVNPWEPTI